MIANLSTRSLKQFSTHNISVNNLLPTKSPYTTAQDGQQCNINNEYLLTQNPTLDVNRHIAPKIEESESIPSFKEIQKISAIKHIGEKIREIVLNVQTTLTKNALAAKMAIVKHISLAKPFIVKKLAPFAGNIVGLFIYFETISPKFAPLALKKDLTNTQKDNKISSEKKLELIIKKVSQGHMESYVNDTLQLLLGQNIESLSQESSPTIQDAQIALLEEIINEKKNSDLEDTNTAKCLNAVKTAEVEADQHSQDALKNVQLPAMPETNKLSITTDQKLEIAAKEFVKAGSSLATGVIAAFFDATGITQECRKKVEDLKKFMEDAEKNKSANTEEIYSSFAPLSTASYQQDIKEISGESKEIDVNK